MASFQPPLGDYRLMKRSRETEVSERVKECARTWGVAIERTLETETSVIAFGRRDGRSLVLKVICEPGDEWHSGEITAAFDGHGVVRVYEYIDGAALLECVSPGHSLAAMVQDGRDDEATEILAEVLRTMSPLEPVNSCPTVQDWSQGFERYLTSGDDQIPKNIVEKAHRVYSTLCDSQRNPRLLHGDLHHHNVLLDSDRGWLAIDPKGVVGEIEYEIGAILRNPQEMPELCASTTIIEGRIRLLAGGLNLDCDRVRAWSFVQAVLSAVWGIEDGHTVDATDPSLLLAHALEPMLVGIR